MVRLLLSLILLAPYAHAHAQTAPSPLPIIDMHVHAPELAEYEQLVGPAPIPHCIPMTDYPAPDSKRTWSEIFKARNNPCRATWSPSTSEEVMEKTLAIMRRQNVYAVTSGARLSQWQEVARERIIPSMSFAGPGTIAAEQMRRGFQTGDFLVLGEVTVQYRGMAPDDPALEPYWSLAEELDVPVGIHVGTGPVGAPYAGFTHYRARLHSPLLLEEVLVRHPKLRVYIMHAGWPMLDDLLAVLWTHPQVHVDTGAISWALPRREFHRYLERVVDAGFGKRVMFGSDQMVWPETLEMAIDSIRTAVFLTDEQKRDILFNNAARFLRLPEGQVRAMHTGSASPGDRTSK